MKKIVFLGALLFLLTGCLEDNVDEIKNLKIKGCSSETLEESVNLYLKDATWKKDNDIYIIEGVTNNKENVVINVSITNDIVEIKKLLVDKVNVTSSLDDYMSNMCSNYSAPKKDAIPEEKEEAPSENIVQNNPPDTNVNTEQNVQDIIQVTPDSSEKVVEPPKQELKPVNPLNPNNTESKNTSARCGISFYDDNDILYTNVIKMHGNENYVVDQISMSLTMEFNYEIDFETFLELREEFFSTPGAKGMTRSISRYGDDAIIIEYTLYIDEIDTNNPEDKKLLDDLFGDLNYSASNIKDIVSSLRESQYTCNIFE